MISTLRFESRGALGALPVYSSSATWKLEPPKPKLDTLARRGWDDERIHGRAWAEM